MSDSYCRNHIWKKIDFQKVPGSDISSRYEFLQFINHFSRKNGLFVKFLPFNAFVATIICGEQSPNKLRVTMAGHFLGFSFRALTKFVESNSSIMNFKDSGRSPIVSKIILTDLSIKIPAGSIADG